MTSVQKHRSSQPKMYAIPLSSTMSINLLGVNKNQQNNNKQNNNVSTVNVAHSPPSSAHLDNARRHYVNSSSLSNPLTVVSVKSSDNAANSPISPMSLSSSSGGSLTSSGSQSPAIVYVSSPSALSPKSAGGPWDETDSAMGTSLAEDARSSVSVFSEMSSTTTDDSSTDVTATDAEKAATTDDNVVTASPRFVRVALMSKQDLTAMLKVSCRTDSAASDSRLVGVLGPITAACLDEFSRDKKSKANLTTPQILKLRLADRQLVKEHIAALSRDLNDDIIICEAICRRSTKEDIIGTSVHDIIKQPDSRCIIGKSGVIVQLHMKNKYAPLQEFIDQLCYHIHVAKPTSLGNPGKVKLGRRAASSKLLSQPFAYDLIIPVAEAARRSFVDIKDFTLYH